MHLFMAIAVRFGLVNNINQFDVPTAYVKATLDETLYMMMPEKFSAQDYKHKIGDATSGSVSGEETDRDVLLLVKGMYGLKEAGRQ